MQPMVCHQLGRATRAKTKRVLKVALEVAMGPLFVAVGRPGSPLFTRDDLAFANEVVELCESRGVLCLGVFVATPASVREVPEALRRVA